jgi:hypothetical protein
MGARDPDAMRPAGSDNGEYGTATIIGTETNAKPSDTGDTLISLPLYPSIRLGGRCFLTPYWSMMALAAP